MNGKWIRVSRMNPCVICRKPNWCLLARDGSAAICARIKSERPAGFKGAGWLHSLITSPRPLLPLPKPKPAVPQAPKAPPDALDAAYRALLAELPLSATHRNNLVRRGLTDRDINRLGYKTLPIDGRSAIVDRLKAKGIALTGVPGFWLESAKLRLAGPAGLAIPVRDLRGCIHRLQIRCDQIDDGKYKWLSSTGRPFGCSSGAPVHVAGPVSTNGEVWITEGPLKADIAAMKLRCIVLGVAGVSNWRGVLPIIREIAPNKVVVAFDMDKNKNAAVRLYAYQIVECLLKHGLRCFEAAWDSNYKGIDDLLNGGQNV